MEKSEILRVNKSEISRIKKSEILRVNKSDTFVMSCRTPSQKMRKLITEGVN